MADLLLRQRLLGDQFGMKDKRLTEAIHDISSTFCGRTFDNMMPLVLEVLSTMTKKHDFERETICVSYGIRR